MASLSSINRFLVLSGKTVVLLENLGSVPEQIAMGVIWRQLEENENVQWAGCWYQIYGMVN